MTKQQTKVKIDGAQRTEYYGCAKWHCDAVNAAWEAFSVGFPTKHTYCLNHIPWFVRLKMRLKMEINNNLDDSQKQFIGPTSKGGAYNPVGPRAKDERLQPMPEEPEVKEILVMFSKKLAMVQGEYNAKEKLSIVQHHAEEAQEEAKQALDRYYRQKYLKVALAEIDKCWSFIEFPIINKNELIAALKEAFK